MPEFYTIIARIFSRIYFFAGARAPLFPFPSPVSYAYGFVVESVLNSRTQCLWTGELTERVIT